MIKITSGHRITERTPVLGTQKSWICSLNYYYCHSLSWTVLIHVYTVWPLPVRSSRDGWAGQCRQSWVVLKTTFGQHMIIWFPGMWCSIIILKTQVWRNGYSESCHSFCAPPPKNNHHSANITSGPAANLRLVWDNISYRHLKLNSLTPIITMGPVFVLYSQASVPFFFGQLNRDKATIISIEHEK